MSGNRIDLNLFAHNVYVIKFPYTCREIVLPSIALYFSSISTILGGPGGPFACNGTDGFSRKRSSCEISSPLALLGRLCCSLLRRHFLQIIRIKQIVKSSDSIKTRV